MMRSLPTTPNIDGSLHRGLAQTKLAIVIRHPITNDCIVMYE